MGLDTVELVMSVENQFNIEIPDNEAENIATVQQLIDYTFEKIKQESQEKILSKTEVKHLICEMISDITGIPLIKITSQHSFVNDLGMN